LSPEVAKTLGQRIRETRLKLGLTQEGLGKRASLHYSYVGQVERGNKVPSVKTLRRMAAALNISVEALLHEEPQKTGSDEDLLIKELNKIVQDCTPIELRLYINIIGQIKVSIRGLENKNS